VQRRAFICAATILLAFMPIGQAHAETKVSDRTWRAYASAISDAAVSRPSEVVMDLVVADPSDRRTQWTTIDGQAYMLVSHLGYRPLSQASPGEVFAVASYVFVTVPEEVQRECKRSRCTRMNASQLDLRLKQLVGLPPDADYGFLTQMWVRPTDLFRPCTQVDPTIPTCPQLTTNTTYQGVNRSTFLLDQAMYSWRLPRSATPSKVSCARDFRNETDGNCFGFPWTRLGYTFDWRPGSDERGVTEFVVAPGSSVVLESFGTQRTYFPFQRKPSSTSRAGHAGILAPQGQTGSRDFIYRHHSYRLEHVGHLEREEPAPQITLR